MNAMNLESKQRFFSYVMMAPLIVMVLVILVYPFVYALVLSFTDRDLFGTSMSFVRLSNFQDLLGDSDFWQNLKSTLAYTFWCTLVTTFGGLATAMLLVVKFRGNYYFRAVLTFPYLVPTIVAVLIFQWMLNDVFGIVNQIAVSLGILNEGVGWFDTTRAMFSCVMVSVWRFFPFAVMLFVPALEGIPEEFYEAARVDGAGPVQRFFHVTLPEIKEVLFVVVILRAIWMFNMFDIIWLLTGGGPVGKTEILPIMAYLQAFQEYDVGLGSATRRSGSDRPGDIDKPLCEGGKKMISLEDKQRVSRIATVVTLMFPVLFVILPYLWMALCSVATSKELFSEHVIPLGYTFSHYRDLFERTNFGRQFLNSSIVAVAATLICLVASTFAGYSLSRFRHRWNFERMMLIVYTIPPVLMVIPILLIFTRLHLTNTYLGLALGHSTFMLPFAALIMAAYFNNIPKALDEAAMVDGATRIGALFKVILPLALPGIAATGVIIFANSWNDFLYAFTLISTRQMQTLPVGVSELSDGQTMQWGMLMAAATLITAPMLVFFLFIQRKLLAGFIFAVTGEK